MSASRTLCCGGRAEISYIESNRERPQQMASTGAGLEGVVATSSNICYIDGEQGILSYYGYNIHTLAEHATFEEVIFLLWNGHLPNADELARLKAELVAERELPEEVTRFLGSVPKSSSSRDV